MNKHISSLRFDDALPAFIRYLIDAQIDVYSGVVLRDGFGRLAFYSRSSISRISTHQRNLQKLLGKYTFPAGAIQYAGTVGESILHDPTALPYQVHVDGKAHQILVVDRRFYGRDWLVTPSKPIVGMPPLMTFGSIKGGVGRTTALFVLAMHLARQGKNVLLIDLDLEAPGLASLVFEGDERPKYGVLDYLVENALNGVSDADLTNFVGTSVLTDREVGHGRVDLAPATGTATLDSPVNMLSKLARALIEDPVSDGPPKSLADQTRELVQRLAKSSAYDVVLVDARAGLAELTAGPLLGLGGVVALFGTDHPHTFEGYRYLTAHLSLLPLPDEVDDWRERIRFVHAKSSASSDMRSQFDDRLYELLSETFYEEDEGDDVFTFSLKDEAAPHRAWRIFFDSQFLDVDPIRDRSVLESDVYKAAFGSFLDSACDALGLKVRGGNDE